MFEECSVSRFSLSLASVTGSWLYLGNRFDPNLPQVKQLPHGVSWYAQLTRPGPASFLP